VSLFDEYTYGKDHMFLLESLWKATNEVNLAKKWAIFKGSLRGPILAWYWKCETHKKKLSILDHYMIFHLSWYFLCGKIGGIGL
jgi:hypothetical protein